jgi:hypothetical protein
VGLLTDPSLPGLPATISWNLSQGGSGFSPPYLFPNPLNPAHAAPFQANSTDDLVAVTMREGAKPVTAHGATANRFCQALTTRHDPPPSVFCSRELERELCEFVTAQVVAHGRAGFPDDEAIRERARAFLAGQGGAAAPATAVAGAGGDGGGGYAARTPADDPVLLGKFKEMMMVRLGLSQGGFPALSGQAVAGATGGMALTTGQGREQGQRQGAADLDMSGVATAALAGGELDDALQQMDFNFGDLGDLMGVATGGMPMDQL